MAQAGVPPHRGWLLSMLLLMIYSCTPTLGIAVSKAGETSAKALLAGDGEVVGRSAELHRAFEHLAAKQCFPFSLQNSIARDDFVYPDLLDDGKKHNARRGDLILLRCDSVICPNPRVPDCYMEDGVCSDHEWCNLEDQVRFGPWAMVPSGETPNVGLSVDCEYYKSHGFDFIYQQVCSNHTNWGPWKPVRGRCQAYRQEQQSCNAYFAAAEPAPRDARVQSHGSNRNSRGHDRWQGHDTGSSFAAAGSVASSNLRRLLTVDSYHPSSQAGRTPFQGLQSLWPQYVVDDTSGRPPARPLLCAPGLVCTGDVEPMPHTCVKIRPPNVCYQGPWWDSSSWCKVGGASSNRLYSGLPLSQLKLASQALLIQLPTEVYGNPNNTGFWNSSAADVARRKIQRIVQVLWPELYKHRTTFPLSLPDPRLRGAPDSKAWNHTAAEAAALYRQSNKVWSTIHTLIHNCRDPMPAQQVRASRSLAVWLRQHFMCCNCRGMWANYVLNVIGLPPKTTSREKHKLWWWRAHNMVSEHAAASRGGHPWVYPSQLDEQFEQQYRQYGDHLKCQNPFFLPAEFIDDMWDIDDAVAAID